MEGGLALFKNGNSLRFIKVRKKSQKPFLYAGKKVSASTKSVLKPFLR